MLSDVMFQNLAKIWDDVFLWAKLTTQNFLVSSDMEVSEHLDTGLSQGVIV